MARPGKSRFPRAIERVRTRSPTEASPPASRDAAGRRFGALSAYGTRAVGGAHAPRARLAAARPVRAGDGAARPWCRCCAATARGPDRRRGGGGRADAGRVPGGGVALALGRPPQDRPQRRSRSARGCRPCPTCSCPISAPATPCAWSSCSAPACCCWTPRRCWPSPPGTSATAAERRLPCRCWRWRSSRSTLVRPQLPYLQGLLLFGLLAAFMWGERLRRDAAATALTVAVVAGVAGALVAPADRQPGAVGRLPLVDGHAGQWPPRQLQLEPDLRTAALAALGSSGADRARPLERLLEGRGPGHLRRPGVGRRRRRDRPRAPAPAQRRRRAAVLAEGHRFDHRDAHLGRRRGRLHLAARRLGRRHRARVRTREPGGQPRARARDAPTRSPATRPTRPPRSCGPPAAAPATRMCPPPPIGRWRSPSGATARRLSTTEVRVPGVAQHRALRPAQLVRASPYGGAFALARRLARRARTPYDFVTSVKRYLSRGYSYNERPPAAQFPLESFLFDRQGGLLPAVLGCDGAAAADGRDPRARGRGLHPGAFDNENHSWQVPTPTPMPGWRRGSPSTAGCASTPRRRRRRPAVAPPPPRSSSRRRG